MQTSRVPRVQKRQTEKHFCRAHKMHASEEERKRGMHRRHTCLFLFWVHRNTMELYEVQRDYQQAHARNSFSLETPLRLPVGAAVRNYQSSAPFPFVMRPNGTRVFYFNQRPKYISQGPSLVKDQRRIKKQTSA